MNLKVIEKKENILLSRKEVIASINFDGATPKRKDVQKELAKELKAKENMTLIKQIDTEYGSSFAKVTANIYSDEAVMLKLERKNLIEKHLGHEPKKEEEAK
jgi:small subunit ribosomal protein S24e